METNKRTPMGAADAKASNNLIVGLGVGIITTVMGLSVTGTITAINAMNRQSEEAIESARLAAENMQTGELTDDTDDPVTPVSGNTGGENDGIDSAAGFDSRNTDSGGSDGSGGSENPDGGVIANFPVTNPAVISPSDDPMYDGSPIVNPDVESGTGENASAGTVSNPDSAGTAEDNWISDQIRWMMKNHIRYNEYGLPEDENGNLADDPTTQIYDPARSAYFYNSGGARPQIADEFIRPEASGEAVTTDDTSSVEVWWKDNAGNPLPGICLDENGQPYYIVQAGDSLGKIGNRFGFGVDELVRENQIVNPNLIHPGEIIRFPGRIVVTYEGINGQVYYSQAPGRG